MTPKDLINAWDEIGRQAEAGAPGPYLHLQMKGGTLPIGAILRAKDRRPGLLVRFPASNLGQLPKPDSGRGFSFERPVTAGNGTLGLPILLGDPSVKDLFALMGADLVSEVENTEKESNAAERVLRRIALWRRFLQRREGLMSNEEVRGLYGELHVLSIAITIKGVDETLDAWHGPERELHDFKFEDGLLEVKSWRAESGAKIHISQPNQIAVDSKNPLRIAAVQISTGGNTGKTLSETIYILRDKMNGMQIQRFDELLAAYGYLEVHANEYHEKMLVLAIDTYEVREGFPHIEARFIPGGIANLHYSIELGSLEVFRIDNIKMIQK